ncbi:YhdP family protein [Beggiatoa leptomitoformis]|uniref:DUF3971 domain-containing protein n=1 Tax=Beggiatoa leptomitoformis TaxID=288004 RepID=A0A2N9YAU6_9GAMM|nr:AsmA-like C-terminal region-containing protein [Beggiatoa leptomitoformis]ALG67049.1 DUF3971 domain-containing protein [Beggiatoa leptomitoformis]AUI67570.1 DUF3971 domain-containing protein [Beggiatoa leptomitoformis]
MFFRYSLFFICFLRKTILVISGLFAVGIFIVYLLFPYSTYYKTDIEQWLSEQLQQSVTIGQLETRWLEGQPVLHLEQVQLKNTHNKASFIIQSVDVFFNLWASITEKTAITAEIRLHIPQLAVTSDTAGQFSIAGFPLPATTTTNDPDYSPHWLQWLWQQAFVVVKVDNFSESSATNPPVTFSALTLRLTPQDTQQQIQLALTIPSQPRFPLATTHITLVGMMQLQTTRLPDIQVHFALQPQKTSTRLQGAMQFTQSPDASQRLTINALQLQTTQHKWLLPNIYLHQHQQKIDVNLRPFSVTILSPLLDFLPLNNPLRQTIAQAHFSGELDDINAHYSPALGWVLLTDFKNLSIQWLNTLPRLINARGQIKLAETQGYLALQQAGLALHNTDWFSQGLVVNQLQGEWSWYRTAEAWQWATTGFRVADAFTSVKLIGNITLPLKSKIPSSDLQLTIEKGQVNQAYRYVPDKLVPITSAWLKKALVSGVIESAQIDIRGRWDALFTDKNPLWRVSAQIDNAYLQYGEQYPPIEKISAELTMHGREMVITANKGLIFTSQLQAVTVIIDDIAAKIPVLTIMGEMSGSVADGLRFLQDSPLHKTVVLGDELQLAGELGLKLDMQLPLAANVPATTRGELRFRHTDFTHKRLNITLRQLQGSVFFDDNSLLAQKLQGFLYDMPISLAFQENRQAVPKRIQAQLSGRADANFIRQQLSALNSSLADLPYHQWFTGETTWQAALDLPVQAKANSEQQITITSDLKGLAVQLPAPLAKKASKNQPLYINTTRNQLTIRYGDIFNALLQLDEQGIEQGSIYFGAEKAILPATQKLQIQGELSEFSLLAWQELLNTLPQGNMARALPLDTNLVIEQLSGLGYETTGLILDAQYKKPLLQMQVKNSQIDGQIKWDETQKQLNIDFNELYLTADNSTASKNPQLSKKPNYHLNPHDLPSIAFHADDLHLGQVRLGNVNFFTRPSTQGLILDLFEAKNAGFSLHVEGEWQAQAQQQRTALQIDLNSTDFSQLMQQLGYTDSPISGGTLQANLRTEWQDTPLRFTLAAAQGQLSLLLVDGHLVDMEPGVGRLLGLFDLQTLPRRLAMDFSDVFAVGFGFNQIFGEFTFKKGIAQTDKVVIQAPAAQVEIKGETDLLKQTYQQQVTVMPHISNTLPIAGTLVGGLGVGAVVMIVQKLLEAEIEKTINYQYIISGDWKNPQITPITKESPAYQKQSEP